MDLQRYNGFCRNKIQPVVCGLTGHPGMHVVAYHGKCSCLGDRNGIVLDCFLLRTVACLAKCTEVNPP